jgi:hypothetical protein
MTMSGWVGVDLDGTLAVYNGWKDGGAIGEPVPLMAKRVKEWLLQGVDVRIVTARYDMGEFEILRIKAWTKQHFGVELKVTNAKNFAMIELWDDRAVSVQGNTGFTSVAVATKRMWDIFSAACNGGAVGCSKDALIKCTPKTCPILKKAGETPE